MATDHRDRQAPGGPAPHRAERAAERPTGPADLLARARSGDGEAFRALVGPHRRELLVHCYRMLGARPDAEDALQDTLLAAWQGLAGYQERASLRTWLHRIATNRCLNALRTTRRRPAAAWPFPDLDPPEPTHLGEVTWVGPFPDALTPVASEAPPGPEARYEQAEAMTLAFVTALQALPARQRAVLVLRDVLGYPADEVATTLDTTASAVHSALKRARAALHRHRDATAAGPDPASAGPPPVAGSPLVAGSPGERALAGRLAEAYATGRVDELVALLAADARLAMPPIPFEYHGRDAVAGFYTAIALRPGRRFDAVPTRANGQPALGLYLHATDGAPRPGTGVDVLTVTGTHITAITHFDATALPALDLPRSLPPR